MSANAFNGGFDAAIGTSDVTSLIEATVGITPEFEDSFDLLRLNPDDRLQIRIGTNVAPKPMVERFAFQMTLSKFPPLVTTEDDKIVDGNTRYHACRQREERWFPAYVIPVSYDDADEEMQDRLVLLGKLLNNSNGLPLDRQERRDMIARALRLGLSQAQMQGTIGFKPATLAAVKREIEGEEAIKRLGLTDELEMEDPDKRKLKGSALGAIGQFANMNDEPLAKVIELAAEAQLGAREIKGLLAEAKDAKSDKAAVRIVKNARKENDARIVDVKAGRVGKPPASRLLRQRLGFINARSAESMVEHNPEQQSDHLDMLRTSMEVLEEVERLQIELMGATK